MDISYQRILLWRILQAWKLVPCLSQTLKSTFFEILFNEAIPKVKTVEKLTKSIYFYCTVFTFIAYCGPILRLLRFLDVNNRPHVVFSGHFNSQSRRHKSFRVVDRIIFLLFTGVEKMADWIEKELCKKPYYVVGCVVIFPCRLKHFLLALLIFCYFTKHATQGPTERGRFDELVPRTFPIFIGNGSSDSI